MKRLRSITAAIAISAALCAAAFADPLDPAQVPADAKWVIHVDMDAARDTQVFKAVDQQMQKSRDFQNAENMVGQITGMKYPQDLHDVTLYGRSAADEAGVVIVHGNIDRNRTLGFLQMNEGFGRKAYGDREILTWDDKGKTMYGAFKDDGTVIIGKSEDLIRSGLDVIDGKAAAIKVDSPLAAGAKPQVLAYVAAEDLAKLKKDGEAQSPMLGLVQSAWISLTEADGNAVLKANVQTKDADTAEQLGQMLGGFKAMVALSLKSTADADGDADAQKLATNVSTIMKGLKCKQEDKNLIVDWSVAVDKGYEAIQALIKKKTAEQAVSN